MPPVHISSTGHLRFIWIPRIYARDSHLVFFPSDFPRNIWCTFFSPLFLRYIRPFSNPQDLKSNIIRPGKKREIYKLCGEKVSSGFPSFYLHSSAIHCYSNPLCATRSKWYRMWDLKEVIWSFYVYELGWNLRLSFRLELTWLYLAYDGAYFVRLPVFRMILLFRYVGWKCLSVWPTSSYTIWHWS